MKNVSLIKKVDFPQTLQELNKLDTDLLLFVIDSEIQKSYSDFLKQIPSFKGKKVISFVSTSGEGAKTFEEFQNGVNFFLEKNIHRKAHLIAIGGGACSDLAGFIAATLLRGISWSVVPTTLLSMVDAAIGGKTAINSNFGKNLIGAFHLPRNIFINPEFLKTLKEVEFNCGLGEIIKYGMINKEIFELIIKKHEMIDILFACANFKNSIVINDFQESGIRQILNYGHTFGHAIEKHYQISHGESVFWGIYLICLLFETKESLIKLLKLNEAFGNPFKQPPWLHKTIPVQNFIDYIKKDKKKIDNDNVNLVLSGNNQAEIKKFNLKDIEMIFNKNLNELKKIEIKNK